MLTSKVYDRLFVDVFNFILKKEQTTLKQGEFSDLSINELHTLDVIDRTPHNKMRDVANKLEITLSTFTTAVNNLTKKGYVETRRSTKDKRVVTIKLTDKAKKALDAHDRFHTAMVSEAVNSLSENEKVVLESALGKLCDFFVSIN